VPLLLAGLGAWLWFSGVLPRMLGLTHPPPTAAQVAAAQAPVLVDMPEIVANLNSAGRRPSYIKLSVRLQVPNNDDAEKVKAAMSKLQDLLQTYLREMRPEELHGSEGTYRLREELIARANIAVAPGRVTDVLFPEMLVQ
jgi:flagellar FliL protein